MLTRFVRNQLIIFTIASIVGVAVMLFTYMQAPTLLGTRAHQRDAGTAVRRRSVPLPNVTYRGVQVGKVTDDQADRERRGSDDVP